MCRYVHLQKVEKKNLAELQNVKKMTSVFSLYHWAMMPTLYRMLLKRQWCMESHMYDLSDQGPEISGSVWEFLHFGVREKAQA